MFTLVIQSFGRENEYKRAILTILSFYAHGPENRPDETLLFTDRPDYFAPYVSGLPVRYVLLTPEKIRNMRGSIDFLHRMKIALIEEAFQSTNGNLLYADSDTFFLSDPVDLMNHLAPGKSFMHVHEYDFEFMRAMPLPSGEPFRAYLELVEAGPLHLADGNLITVTAQHSSWNAGVMLLHKTHSALIPDIYALTDQTYPATGNHACEQYAFSIMLQERTELAPCDSVIYHYWYRVKKAIIDQFLEKNLDHPFIRLPLARKLKKVHAWTELLPRYLEQHVFTLRDNAIQTLNEDKFSEGYKWAVKALLKEPLNNKHFIRDVFYHMKRQLVKR
jgi:hypothetical protein